MNLWILLAIVGMFVHSWQAGLGLLTGLAICFLFLMNKEQRIKAIEYHLTHWSWNRIDV